MCVFPYMTCIFCRKYPLKIMATLTYQTGWSMPWPPLSWSPGTRRPRISSWSCCSWTCSWGWPAWGRSSSRRGCGLKPPALYPRRRGWRRIWTRNPGSSEIKSVRWQGCDRSRVKCVYPVSKDLKTSNTFIFLLRYTHLTRDIYSQLAWIFFVKCISWTLAPPPSHIS